MNTTPVYDDSKPAPSFARVYYADGLGRKMDECFEQFRSRKAAAAYWWVMARRGIVGFLPDENGFGRSNKGLTRDQEPAEIKAWIEQADREWIETEAENDEAAHYALLSRSRRPQAAWSAA